MSNLTKAQQKFVDRLLDSFEKEVVPWRAAWDQSILKPYNAASNIPYKGINALNLYITSMENGYNDPRWMTFKQANAKGYQIKKGSVGTDIFFYSFRNMETGELVEQSDLAKMEEEERKNIRLVTKSYVVFNANQISGIPDIDIEQHAIDFKNDKAKEFITALSKNAKMDIQHFGNKAYYNPTKDIVVCPSVEAFKDEQSYYATLLHECGHATMHTSRLNRDAIGAFGSEKYAKEELRAELTSAFLTMDIGFHLDEMHEKNHQAYIQSWKKIIKDEPRFIFTAIRDAQKIQEYLLEKGDYEKIYKIEKDPIIEKKEEKVDMLEINEVNFPDEKFREYISRNFDLDCDGVLSREEIHNVKEIDVSERHYITSVKGIEHFPNLQELGCYRTGITSLDISHNPNLERLWCTEPEIKELDLSNNPKLTYLNCSDTGITSLDVSKNTKLEELDCYKTGITSLDVSNCTSLEKLACYVTKITELDLSNNPALTLLACSYTEITELDISKNPKLEKVLCRHTKIKELDLSNNSALKELWCANTQITTLNISQNSDLKVLSNHKHITLIRDSASIQEKVNQAKDTLKNKPKDIKEVKSKEKER